MKNWWYGLTLRNKLQIPTQLLLLAVLTCAQILVMKQFEKKMYEDAAQNAKGSVMQSFLALNGMMLAGNINPAERTMFFKKMNEQEHVLNYHLVRGKVISDDSGPGLPEENASDELDQAAMSSNAVQMKVRNDDAHSMRVVVPIAVKQNFWFRRSSG